MGKLVKNSLKRKNLKRSKNLENQKTGEDEMIIYESETDNREMKKQDVAVLMNSFFAMLASSLLAPGSIEMTKKRQEALSKLLKRFHELTGEKKTNLKVLKSA